MRHLIQSALAVLGAGIMLVLLPSSAFAQTGIGTRTPDPSSILDVRSTSKGLLIPRVALTALNDATTVASPATSLLVYNTNAALVGGAGFYYNEGTSAAPSWVRFVSSAAPVGLQFWGVLGNAGTSPSANFLGTTDAQDLAFRVGNVERMRLYQGGGLGLGNTSTRNLLLGMGAAQAPVTGTNNTLVGVSAGQAVSSGNDNTLLGAEAGKGVASGAENTYLGRQAGQSNVSGNKGTFVGASSGANTSGNDNTFIGYGAGLNNTIGTGNTAVGLNAGSTSSNGTNNTFIGNGANSVVGSLSNATAIGAGALVGSNNTISLGNGAVRVGIGTLTGTPAQTLHVVGGARIEALGGPTPGSGGDRLVVTDNNGDLSTRPIPAVVNPGSFIQNINSGTQSGANFSIDGTGLVGGNLGVGTLSPQQKLDVNGNGTFSGNLGLGVVSPTQKLDVNGGANVSGNTTIGGTLGVTGLSNLSGGYTATNGALSGTLGVSGLSTLSTVRITGIGAGGSFNRQVVITPSGDLATQAVPAAINAVLNQTSLQTGANFNVDGAGTVGGLLTAGSARITGLGGSGTRLVVTDNNGNISTQAVPGAGILNQTTQQAGANFNISGSGTVGTLGVASNATVGGTLGVTGPASLSTVSTSGAATLNSAAVTNNATVGGTLGVTGATTLSSATISGLGGGGTRLVVTDNAGNLSTQAVPTPVNAVLNQNSTDQSANFRISGNGQLGGNLVVSANNAAGGGITLSDDGDLVDNNDGYATARFSNGLRISQGKNNNNTAILLRNNGSALFNAYAGGGNRSLGVDNNGELVALTTPSGSTFIQNQSGTDQTANFRINGVGLIGTRLGVGLTNPNAAYRLQVSGGDTRIAADNGEQGLFGLDKLVGLNDLRFYTDNTGTTEQMRLETNGVLRIYGLGGSGSRIVTADASGNLSATSAVPGSNGEFIANSGTQAVPAFNVAGAGQIGQTLGVTGATSLSTVSTSGAATLNSAAVTNNATVGGTLGVTGATTLSTLTTNGLATLNSARVNNLGGGGSRVVIVDNNGNLQTQATVGSTGEFIANTGTTSNPAFTVTGGTVGTTGLIVNGPTSVNSGLTVTGTSSLGVLNAGNTTVNTLSAGATSASTLSTSGAATLNSAAVTNGLTAGSVSTGGLTATAAQVNGTLGVTGTPTFGTLGGSGTRYVVADGAGNLSTQAIPAAVNAVLNQNASDQAADFRISGNGRAGSLTVNNGATVGTALTVGTSLGVSGAATLNSATVTNNANVGGNLGVTGAATLNNTLNVTGATTLGDLAGSGSRYVVANSAGQLSTQAIPAAVNAVLNQTTLQSGANFNIGGSGTVGNNLTVSGTATAGNLVVTNTTTLNGATTVNNNLTVSGANNLTVAQLAGTGNRVVVANSAGALTPTSFTLPTNGFIENQTATAQIGGFNVDGSGAVGADLNAGGSIIAAAAVTAGANVQAGANLVAGANLTVGAESRLDGRVGVRLTSTPTLTESLMVNGNIVPEAAGLGSLGLGGTFGLRWNGLFVENALVGIPNASAPGTDRLTVNGNVLPFVTAASNLGSSTLRWGSLFASVGNFNGNVVPNTNNTFSLGTTGARWSTINSVAGNYSGNLTVTGSGNNAFTGAVVPATNGGASLGVTGTRWGSLFVNNATITTALTASGTLAVTGAVTANSTLAVTGTTALTGNVGIGVVAGAQKLTVAGNVVPSVDATHTLGTSALRWNDAFIANGVTQTSDARLKTNVTNLGYGLSTVMALRPVRYAWKRTPTATNKIGFIAQELQQVLPEVVTVGDDANHTLGVNYAELVPVLVKALQEQQQQLDAMRSRAEKAEAGLQSFEARLRALEAGSPANATAQGQR